VVIATAPDLLSDTVPIARWSISFDDLPFLDLLAGSGVMWAERDACRAARLIRVFASTITA
jgi:hypothetical protein